MTHPYALPHGCHCDRSASPSSASLNRSNATKMFKKDSATCMLANEAAESLVAVVRHAIMRSWFAPSSA